MRADDTTRKTSKDSSVRTLRDDIRLLSSSLQETRETVASLEGILQGWEMRCRTHSDDIIAVKRDCEKLWRNAKPKSHANALICSIGVVVGAATGSAISGIFMLLN